MLKFIPFLKMYFKFYIIDKLKYKASRGKTLTSSALTYF